MRRDAAFGISRVRGYFFGSMDACHLVIRGLVQGVGFRWFVQREASARGLTGYTRNLLTGEVEVLAEGERLLLEQLVALVRTGPRSAHVSHVEITWGSASGRHAQFEIR
jgi:acylphosphatase